jgi:hypothetical protein
MFDQGAGKTLRAEATEQLPQEWKKIVILRECL